MYGQRERDADALLVDQYAVAWMTKSKQKLVADVVGQVPQEISRFVYFFLQHGGSVNATTSDERYRSSQLQREGLR